jgi:predicted Fe-S protein YdhL (DUF1289 family)
VCRGGDIAVPTGCGCTAAERLRWIAILQQLKEQAQAVAALCQQVCKAAQEEEFGDGYAKAVSDLVEEINEIVQAASSPSPSAPEPSAPEPSREPEYAMLRKIARAWADFDREDALRGAMTAFEAIERKDASEVLRLAYVEQQWKPRVKTPIPSSCT